jgi:benzodiazapine receptor
MKTSQFIKLVASIAVPELTGVIASMFTTSSVTGWYTSLTSPQASPPNWVFAPVWTTLYLLMGIAVFLVWEKGVTRRDVKIALTVFTGQLILNALWSIIFFGFHNIGGALIEILILWVSILVTIFTFARVSKGAAWLLVPYLLWVSFAIYLNYAIWTLN